MFLQSVFSPWNLAFQLPGERLLGICVLQSPSRERNPGHGWQGFQQSSRVCEVVRLQDVTMFQVQRKKSSVF